MPYLLSLLKMGVKNESFHLSGEIHVANDLLKSIQRGKANAISQNQRWNAIGARTHATIQLQQRFFNLRNSELKQSKR
jgi:hypothetical protein